MIENITTTIMNNAFEWIKTNYTQLEKSYCELPHEQVRSLPFALYCLAMFVKHQGINN